LLVLQVLPPHWLDMVQGHPPCCGPGTHLPPEHAPLKQSLGLAHEAPFAAEDTALHVLEPQSVHTLPPPQLVPMGSGVHLPIQVGPTLHE
jgi:hypothetical protein